MPDFAFEQKIAGLVAGVDEAGRGPWAGPVVAGAAILDPARVPQDLLSSLDDSKKLSAAKRETVFEYLQKADGVRLGIGQASVEEIDRLNILQATFLAMRRAVENLGCVPDFALIDGNKVPPGLPCAAEALVKGDGRSVSIAAASIAAKVTRDRLMAALDRACPGYGWADNAGYGTPAHQKALAALGVSEHHRKSYAPIRKMLSPAESRDSTSGLKSRS